MDSDESIVWFRQHSIHKNEITSPAFLYRPCTGIYPDLQQSAVSVPIQSHHVILAGNSAGFSAQYNGSLFPITEIIGSFVGVTIGL